MPELPEVETVARTLSPHIIDDLILSATLLRPSSLHRLSMPLSSLAGCRITGVRRRAKLLVIDLEPPTPAGPTLLIAHLRMTGRLFVTAQATPPEKHTRCAMLLQKPSGELQQLFFNDTRAFGQLLACRQNDLAAWEFWRALGPEPLSMAQDDLKPRLNGGRPVKTALLDQKVIAGLGNIYVDESLFDSRILPTRPAGSLTGDECRALLRSIQAILRKAIAKKGSSIRDYRDADGNSGSFQKGFFVYGRGGKECKICGNTLERIKLGGRSTVYCSHCQQ